MKVKHTQVCPICKNELAQDKLHQKFGKQDACQVFICFSPLADDPLHYYSHTIKDDGSDWIIFQEFSVDIGSRYVLFNNDYETDKSSIRSAIGQEALDIPVLLIPDFPSLDNLK